MNNKFSFTGTEGASHDLNTSEIVILPVPYDKTSTWVKGAHKGPQAVIEASPALELYDIDTDSEVYKHGIFTMPFLNPDYEPEQMTINVEEKVSELLDKNKFVVTLGGEHSVSAGPIRAYGKKIEGMSVLHLDAHLDMRDEYEGSKFNHACLAARAREICPVVQAGIRSVGPEEKEQFKSNRDDIFLAEDIIGNISIAGDITDKLSDKVYITIDMDVFDPSLMPSTGTPEPGGLLWYDVIRILKDVASKKKIIGFDVVELCPIENNKAPDFVAAKLVYKLLSYIYSK